MNRWFCRETSAAAINNRSLAWQVLPVVLLSVDSQYLSDNSMKFLPNSSVNNN